MTSLPPVRVIGTRTVLTPFVHHVAGQGYVTFCAPHDDRSTCTQATAEPRSNSHIAGAPAPAPQPKVRSSTGFSVSTYRPLAQIRR